MTSPVFHAYHAHGLDIRSTFTLPLTAGDSRPAADLVLRRGAARPIPAIDPPGEPIARLADRCGRLRYSLVRRDGLAVLRYPGLCEFTGTADLSEVRAHVHPGQADGLVSVLAAGALLATHLRLRGDLVLHASAVQVETGAVAFVGASGMGKSTMATLLCAAGHALVSDDVLRVTVTDDDISVHPGSTETRLREAARDLATAVDPGAVRITADGRLALQLRRSSERVLLPLRACVIPLPDRERTRVSLTRLRGSAALVRLARFPRILGWTDRCGMVSEFRQLAALVAAIPVVEARLPWGPPYPPDVADELLDLLAGQR